MSAATMTFEEFERLPDEADDLELLEGEFDPDASSRCRSMDVCLKLLRLFLRAVDKARDDGARVGSLYFEMGSLMPGVRGCGRV